MFDFLKICFVIVEVNINGTLSGCCLSSNNIMFDFLKICFLIVEVNIN
jgi:hypothetical protein